jgi:hypothetical protein
MQKLPKNEDAFEFIRSLKGITTNARTQQFPGRLHKWDEGE